MKNVGCIIENPEMYKNLTGKQNLMQYFRMYDGLDASRIDEVVHIVGLENRINDKVSKYSLGMRQRLGIAQALLNNPKILLLDEPTNGLDPEGIKSMRDLLIDLAHNHGVAVLISSHMLSELESFCDRVCIINAGKTLGTKTMEEIRNFDNENVFKFVLKVGENDKAKDVFDSKGVTYTEIQDKFEISCSEENMQQLLLALIQNGILIKSFTPLERTLEEAFITIIKNSGGSKI
jgi:ABC-2 type transport system ATP-binding protein